MRYTTQEKDLLLAVRKNLELGVVKAWAQEAVPGMSDLHELFQECLDDLNTVFPRERGDGYLGGFNP